MDGSETFQKPWVGFWGQGIGTLGEKKMQAGRRTSGTLLGGGDVDT